MPPDRRLHALFGRRVAGDRALLRLARRRFERAGLAAEVYAGSAQELDGVLAFCPRDARAPMVVRTALAAAAAPPAAG